MNEKFDFLRTLSQRNKGLEAINDEQALADELRTLSLKINFPDYLNNNLLMSIYRW